MKTIVIQAMAYNFFLLLRPLSGFESRNLPEKKKQKMLLAKRTNFPAKSQWWKKEYKIFLIEEVA
jgi:hypothetical protein